MISVRRASADSARCAALAASARQCSIGTSACSGACRNSAASRSARYPCPDNSGKAVSERIASASPRVSASGRSDGRKAACRTSATRPTMPGNIKSGRSPALTSDDLPDPLAPSTRTKEQPTLSRPSHASAGFPIGCVRANAGDPAFVRSCSMRPFPKVASAWLRTGKEHTNDRTSRAQWRRRPVSLGRREFAPLLATWAGPVWLRVTGCRLRRGGAGRAKEPSGGRIAGARPGFGGRPRPRRSCRPSTSARRGSAGSQSR
jgi:hypothetical protein